MFPDLDRRKERGDRRRSENRLYLEVGRTRVELLELSREDIRSARAGELDCPA